MEEVPADVVAFLKNCLILSCNIGSIAVVAVGISAMVVAQVVLN